MNIILADDHIIFREGLKLLLTSQAKNNIVAEANDALELKQLVQQYQPDMVVMDYHMPKGDSLDTLDYIKKRFPEIKVIVLTGSHSGFLLKLLVKSKSDAILLKEDSANTLLSVIEKVLKGKRVIPESVKEKIDNDDFELTQREYQILSLLVKGKSSTEISELLNIAARTVDKHRENIMKKMAVNNVAQMVAVTFRMKLIEE